MKRRPIAYFLYFYFYFYYYFNIFFFLFVCFQIAVPRLALSPSLFLQSASVSRLIVYIDESSDEQNKRGGSERRSWVYKRAFNVEVISGWLTSGKKSAECDKGKSKVPNWH